VKSVKIIGVGRCVPPRIVTNDDLARIVDTSDEWIRERTGIRCRHFVEKDVATSDLAAESIQAACAQAGISPHQLDGIIVGTCSPDTIFPSTACWTQNRLGVHGMPAFDVMAGCSSFLYGLEVAANWVSAGGARYIAVCGAETFSKLLDFQDRTTCVLFGDAAGAAIVAPGDGHSGILASTWGSDGTQAPILAVPAGGSRQSASRATVDERLHYVRMEGSKVFKHAVRSMSQALVDTLAAANIEHEAVDLLIPHQANVRIMEATRERTRIGPDKVFSVLEKYGNISAASIPVALAEAREQGRLRDGDIVAMTAFGAGLTWASAVMRY